MAYSHWMYHLACCDETAFTVKLHELKYGCK